MVGVGDRHRALECGDRLRRPIGGELGAAQVGQDRHQDRVHAAARALLDPPRRALELGNRLAGSPLEQRRGTQAARRRGHLQRVFPPRARERQCLPVGGAGRLGASVVELDRASCDQPSDLAILSLAARFAAQEIRHEPAGEGGVVPPQREVREVVVDGHERPGIGSRSAERDPPGALEQGARLLVPVLCLAHDGQVAQAPGHRRMLRHI